jgi:hypothetical protein
MILCHQEIKEAKEVHKLPGFGKHPQVFEVTYSKREAKNARRCLKERRSTTMPEKDSE